MAEIETEVKPEEPTEDDMDISDSDENQGKPPLPPMPPPDDDYNLQNSELIFFYNYVHWPLSCYNRVEMFRFSAGIPMPFNIMYGLNQLRCR